VEFSLRVHAGRVKTVKRIIVFVVGATVLAIGVAWIVLPGPAFLVIPAGLAILGLEFAWARRLLARSRALVEKTFKRPARWRELRS
jgi:uncharacterized protein (TIGR02611 family)